MIQPTTTCLSRGSARHEVHAIDLRIKKGQARPSQFTRDVAVSVLRRHLGAEAAIVLSEERLGYDEYQMTVLLFWRAEEDPS